MGLFSKIITRTVIKAGGERAVKQIAEKTQAEEKKRPKKAHLFKSWSEFVEFVLLYSIASQFLYTMALVISQADNLSWDIFCQSYAIAVFVSIVLFLLGMLGYGLHRVDMLPILFIFLLFPLIAIMSIGFTDGFSVVGSFFLGAWMSPATKWIFFSLGILIVISAFSGMLYYESVGTKKKVGKQSQPPISDEEAERNRSILRTAIQENAITVRFIKRRWNFSTSSDVMFGYDEQNKQFVFVNDKNSHIISSKKVAYLDFEVIMNSTNDEMNTNEHQRLIKLFYLSSKKRESIIPMMQVFKDNDAINKITYYANNGSTDNPETIFRRRVRHLASSLKRELYPCRPFDNDKWFEQLEECMGEITNHNTDGYSLLKEKVVSSENYMDDEVLFSIICDFSVDPPDKTNAKKKLKDYADKISAPHQNHP